MAKIVCNFLERDRLVGLYPRRHAEDVRPAAVLVVLVVRCGTALSSDSNQRASWELVSSSDEENVSQIHSPHSKKLGDIRGS